MLVPILKQAHRFRNDPLLIGSRQLHRPLLDSFRPFRFFPQNENGLAKRWGFLLDAAGIRDQKRRAAHQIDEWLLWSKVLGHSPDPSVSGMPEQPPRRALPPSSPGYGHGPADRPTPELLPDPALCLRTVRPAACSYPGSWRSLKPCRQRGSATESKPAGRGRPVRFSTATAQSGFPSPGCSASTGPGG